MVYCVLLNPTIDKTVEVDGFTVGGTNRVVSMRETAGGKAVNVALVLKALGGDPRVLGVNSRMDGEILRDTLESASIFYDFHDLSQPARVNEKIFDRKAKQITEVNDPGLGVPSDLLGRIADEVSETPDAGEAVVLAGSLPPGAPAGWYADVVARLKQREVRAIVDASGDALKEAVQKGPWMIKPNLDELTELVGHPLKTLDDVAKAAEELQKKWGIEIVMVSLGSSGLFIADREHSLFAPGVKVDVRSTVGAGDSSVAGAIAYMDTTLDDMLRAGAAAATASVTMDGLCDRDAFDTYYSQIEVQESPDGALVVSESL